MELAEARADDRVLEALGERAIRSAELAQRAGFAVDLEVQEWDNGDVYPSWTVTVPAELDKALHGLVWDMPEGQIDYTLTRSTRHPGWQLTNWMVCGEPWGHSDIYGEASEAFDARPTASGIPLAGLSQVVFRDGRVLVREGAQRVAFNPDAQRLKRRLMR
jgi:hypothetical protein